MMRMGEFFPTLTTAEVVLDVCAETAIPQNQTHVKTIQLFILTPHQDSEL
jgi:hypothetical protein